MTTIIYYMFSDGSYLERENELMHPKKMQYCIAEPHKSLGVYESKQQAVYWQMSCLDIEEQWHKFKITRVNLL